MKKYRHKVLAILHAHNEYCLVGCFFFNRFWSFKFIAIPVVTQTLLNFKSHTIFIADMTGFKKT
jgi:hypothetical protein